MAGEIELREFVKKVVEMYPNDKMITEEQVQEIISYVNENSPRCTKGKNKGEQQVTAYIERSSFKGHVFPNGNVGRDQLWVWFSYYRKGRMSDGESWTIALPQEIEA